MGPIELADTVGLDVCAHVGNILKIAPAGGSKLDQMVAAGKLGKKSGEGFYVWKDGKPREGRAREALRQGRAGAAGPRAGRAADPRGERVRDEQRRRERRPGRCRRDLRHRLCAVPRRPAALRGQRAEIQCRGTAAHRRRNDDASGLADRTYRFQGAGPAGLTPTTELTWTRPCGAWR